VSGKSERENAKVAKENAKIAEKFCVLGVFSLRPPAFSSSVQPNEIRSNPVFAGNGELD
jgi:hypothetical protein